ncbi:hypothetical protein BDN70DRAFT_901892 [Pholiota conissans]|uniref:Uncharacterized protein n=1 Tax=Pholiota conissans TaxID=109636 RepID=A0A9P5YMV8_9AGAR|nr:hypothetical protein BDN70DRAFT_901892 [Pholiota conissans]
MSKLTGIDLQKPRRKTGYNVWAPSSRPSLDALVNERAKDSNISGRKKIGLRNRIYKEAYEELDPEEKAEWEAKAQAEYEKAVTKLEVVMNDSASTKPEDRQKSERKAYKQFVVPVFAHFLKKCYTIDECRTAALPIQQKSLADMLNDDDSNFEDRRIPKASRLHALQLLAHIALEVKKTKVSNFKHRTEFLRRSGRPFMHGSRSGQRLKY